MSILLLLVLMLISYSGYHFITLVIEEKVREYKSETMRVCYIECVIMLLWMVAYSYALLDVTAHIVYYLFN
jgi:hypothetical protein